MGQQQLHRIAALLPASARRLLPAAYRCFPMPAASRCAQLLPDACPHQRPRLVFRCATAPLPASLPQRRLSAVAPQRRPCQQRPAQWRPQASSVPLSGIPRPAVALPQRPGQQLIPDGSQPRRPGQQQTSSSGEEYSGLASNLAHLGRIC